MHFVSASLVCAIGSFARKKGHVFFVECTRCLRFEDESRDMAEGEPNEVEDDVVETGRLESSEESGDPGCLD
jgi:hypothetical protein